MADESLYPDFNVPPGDYNPDWFMEGGLTPSDSYQYPGYGTPGFGGLASVDTPVNSDYGGRTTPTEQSPYTITPGSSSPTGGTNFSTGRSRDDRGTERGGSFITGSPNNTGIRSPLTPYPTLPPIPSLTPLPGATRANISGVPIYDRNQVSKYAQMAAAGGIRALRNQVQQVSGGYQANPNVKALTLRNALAGYGQGLESVMSGAQSTGANMYAPEYQGKMSGWRANTEAEMQHAASSDRTNQLNWQATNQQAQQEWQQKYNNLIKSWESQNRGA